MFPYFIKKTQKTPVGEITKARRLREKYFEDKKIQISREQKQIYLILSSGSILDEVKDMKKLTSHKEMLDKYVGKEGTPERERFEAELKAEILSAKIKELRLKRKMTQEQLAKLIGKDKTQISKIERGRNLTIATIVQVVEALGGKINFEIEFAGVV